MNLSRSFWLIFPSSHVDPMNIELFDARVLRPMVRYLTKNGSHAQGVLDQSRIPGELTEAGGWVTKKQAYDFTLHCVQHAESPAAVFTAYLEDFELDHLGPIADAIRSCRTVKEALDTAIRLGKMGYQGSDYFFRIEGETTWWCYREPQEVSHGQPFIGDMTLTVYWNLIRITTGEDWQPEQMLLRGGTIGRHRLAAKFAECGTDYHADHSALAFPTEFLSRRLPWADQPLGFEQPAEWQVGPGHSPADAVVRLLTSRFPYRSLPTLDQLASIVGTSPATLKRQLAMEGITYRGLLDRLRFDAACEMLAVPELTIYEIAHELGYSGANNFVRGFRRMTGVTPGEYRASTFAAG